MVDRRRSANWKGRNVTSLQTISTATGLEAERPMKSPVVKRSIVIAGHKTSVSLEDAFWKGLKEIADQRNVTLSDLVASIDSQRRHGNLSSAIRLFVLDHYRSASMADKGLHSSRATQRHLERCRNRSSGFRRQRHVPSRRRVRSRHDVWIQAIRNHRPVRRKIEVLEARSIAENRGSCGCWTDRLRERIRFAEAL